MSNVRDFFAMYRIHHFIVQCESIRRIFVPVPFLPQNTFAYVFLFSQEKDISDRIVGPNKRA